MKNSKIDYFNSFSTSFFLHYVKINPSTLPSSPVSSLPENLTASRVLVPLAEPQRSHAIPISHRQIRTILQQFLDITRVPMLGAHVQRYAMMTTRSAGYTGIGACAQQHLEATRLLGDCRGVERGATPRVLTVDVLSVLAA